MKIYSMSISSTQSLFRQWRFYMRKPFKNNPHILNSSKITPLTASRLIIRSLFIWYLQSSIQKSDFIQSKCFLFSQALLELVVDLFMKVSTTRSNCPKFIDDNFLDRRRIHEFLFHESPYDPDTSPILNHTHQHPVEVDVWIEIHTINEGFYSNLLIQNESL